MTNTDDNNTIYKYLKTLAESQDISLNKVCQAANLSQQNISKKGRNNTLYYTDIVKLLSALHYHIEIKPDQPNTNNSK